VLAGSLPVFNVILVINFFRNISSSMEEAAYVDGAGPWRTFLQIYIPLSGPVIATVTLFTIVGHWNEFFQGLVLSNKQSSYPLQTYIQQLVVSLDLSTMNTEQIKLTTQLSNKQSSYPLQTYIQQLVVSLDLSTMNTEQIKLTTQLNNKSLNAAKIFIAMVPVLMIYPFLQRYFITGITLGAVKE